MLSSSAKAQEMTTPPSGTTERRMEIEQKKAEKQAQKTSALENRCEKSSESLTRLSENYTRNRAKLQEISTKSIANINKAITRAREKGRDTSLTEASLVTYQEKVALADTEFLKLITLVNATKQYSCMESSKEYKTALEATRTQLRKTNESMQVVKRYFALTLKSVAPQLPVNTNQ